MDSTLPKKPKIPRIGVKTPSRKNSAERNSLGAIVECVLQFRYHKQFSYSTMVIFHNFSCKMLAHP